MCAARTPDDRQTKDDARAPNAMQARPSRSSRNWRSALKIGDEAELRKWIEASGVERVARIVAELADAGGRHGQPEKLRIELLIKIAFLLTQQPERSLHSVALQVARRAHSIRKLPISLESLTSKLERDFRRRRHTWLRIAKNRGALEGRNDQEAIGLRSRAEHRVLARLTELLPGAIDIYDWVAREAKMVGPEEVKLVKRAGRTRVELLFESVVKKMDATPTKPTPRAQPWPPRTFFALIESELRRQQEERNRNSARSRRVGRKPAD